MNMSSRINNDINAVTNSIQQILLCESHNLSTKLQKRLYACNDILQQLNKDVQKEDNETQEKVYEALTGRKFPQ